MAGQDFDSAMAALLGVQPPPSGKKATARKKERAGKKNPVREKR
jgi:hypothetical protein